MKKTSINEMEHFNRTAKEYEENFNLIKPAAIRKIKNLSILFHSYLSTSPHGELLEIGAGTGFLTRHLAKYFKDRHYIVTDISEEMLKIAKSTCNENIVDNMIWLEEDCLSLKIEDKVISCVVGHGILHHLPIEKAIEEISRVLKPNGRIAFYEPNILNPYVFCLKKIPFMRPKGDTPEETAINPFYLKKLLKKNNFTNITIIPCEFTLNGLPTYLIPFFELASRFIEKVPIIKYLGGSLKIMARKEVLKKA